MNLEEYAIHLTKAVERFLDDETLSMHEGYTILEDALAERPLGLIGTRKD